MRESPGDAEEEPAPCPAEAADDGPGLLFAYGTLGPAGPEEVARRGWVTDAIRGRLYDLGPYPGVVDVDDPGAGWVEGDVRPVDRRELLESLDSYEGVAEGLFRRVVATTRGGRRVWVYLYARPLPQWARGPFDRWSGPRMVSDP